jgi:hypothetical protein
MAGRGGGGYGGWCQTWQVEVGYGGLCLTWHVEEVAMEAGIRHGRKRRWLWRLVSDKAGTGGANGGW